MALKHIENLATFDLPNTTDKLVVDVDEINGRIKIGFRVWYQDANGEYQAGRNGFNVDPATAVELLKVKVPAQHLKAQPKVTSTNGPGRKFE